jgi:hypothetical protein
MAISTGTGTPHLRSVALKARKYAGRSDTIEQALSRLRGAEKFLDPQLPKATKSIIARKILLICLSLISLCFLQS